MEKIRNINNYIINNIGIVKTKQHQITQFLDFKKAIEENHWDTDDIITPNIKYICVFGNVLILRYLSKRTDIYLSKEKFVENITIMMWSRHKKAIRFMLNEFYNKQSDLVLKGEIRQTFLKWIVGGLHVELFEFLIKEGMDFSTELVDNLSEKNEYFYKELIMLFHNIPDKSEVFCDLVLKERQECIYPMVQIVLKLKNENIGSVVFKRFGKYLKTKDLSVFYKKENEITILSNFFYGMGFKNDVFVFKTYLTDFQKNKAQFLKQWYGCIF
jgi:hypothetical protein